MQTIQSPNIRRRAALYARVSSDMQAKGLDSQIRALHEYCEQNKIEDYELFADESAPRNH